LVIEYWLLDIKPDPSIKKTQAMKTKLILFFVFIPAALFAQEFRKRGNPVQVDIAPPPVIGENTKPVVIWMSPDQSALTVATPKLQLRVGINSKAKLTKVTLLVNGQVPGEERGIGAASTEAAKFDSFLEKELTLTQGPNEIKVIAENEKGEQTIEVRMVNVTVTLASTLPARTDYALMFATNEYNDWSRLNNPVSDAQAIKKDLEELYGFKVDLVTNPTKSEILSKLREYSLMNYLPDDQLFVFIAGHGKFDDVAKDGYVVARDSRKNDENSESYISFSDLRTRLDNNPCRHIFLTLDACFGGTFDQAIAKRGEDDAEDLAFNSVVQADLIKRKLQYKTRLVLASGGKQYVDDGRAGKHSPFATLFLEALRSGGGRIRVLTTSTIFTYVEANKQVPHYAKFGDNEPGSEFVFVRK
jgi:hypothetical protein